MVYEGDEVCKMQTEGRHNWTSSLIQANKMMTVKEKGIDVQVLTK